MGSPKGDTLDPGQGRRRRNTGNDRQRMSRADHKRAMAEYRKKMAEAKAAHRAQNEAMRGFNSRKNQSQQSGLPNKFEGKYGFGPQELPEPMSAPGQRQQRQESSTTGQRSNNDLEGFRERANQRQEQFYSTGFRDETRDVAAKGLTALGQGLDEYWNKLTSELTLAGASDPRGGNVGKQVAEQGQKLMDKLSKEYFDEMNSGKYSPKEQNYMRQQYSDFMHNFQNQRNSSMRNYYKTKVANSMAARQYEKDRALMSQDYRSLAAAPMTGGGNKMEFLKGMINPETGKEYGSVAEFDTHRAKMHEMDRQRASQAVQMYEQRLAASQNPIRNLPRRGRGRF